MSGLGTTPLCVSLWVSFLGHAIGELHPVVSANVAEPTLRRGLRVFLPVSASCVKGGGITGLQVMWKPRDNLKRQ